MMEDAAAVVLCHPAGMASPALLYWLQDIGVRRGNILFNPGNKWSWAVAMNDSCKRALALPDRIRRFIFADADTRPEVEATAPMLAMPYRATCARCELETGEASWKDPGAFHTGLFIIDRDALASVAPPWFAWSTSDDGSELTACGCTSFAARLRASGQTVGHAGWAGHTPCKSRPPKPFIIREPQAR
jgi:hypothetical protein